MCATYTAPLCSTVSADKYAPNVHVISAEFIFLFSEHDTTVYTHFLPQNKKRLYTRHFQCLLTGCPSSLPQTVFLQDNAIVQIRLQDLTRLGSLHYFYLQNNSISAIEPGAFLSQGQLLELALNGNLIHLVTADMFRGLEHLRILYLAGNQITRVQDHTFRGLHVSGERTRL